MTRGLAKVKTEAEVIIPKGNFCVNIVHVMSR